VSIFVMQFSFVWISGTAALNLHTNPAMTMSSVLRQRIVAAPLAAESVQASDLAGEFASLVPSAAAEESKPAVFRMRGGSSFLASMLPPIAICALAGVWICRVLAPMAGPIVGGVKLVFAGAVAGIISRTCCAPLEMVSTVMMCRGDECSTMWHELAEAWKKQGFKGLFRGNGANCLKVAPSRGTQFLVYEFMKRQLVHLGVATPLSAGPRLFAGGIAGMIAATIVYPLEVVKTVLTLYPDECQGGIPDAVRCVLRHGNGIRGLYRGLLPTLVAMFPYVGVEFMVYETLKGHWEVFIGGKSGTLALLLLGAIGGAAAQAAAHPLDVVRRRMQMQGMKKVQKDGADKSPKINNMFAGLCKIWQDEGPHVLLKGLGPACMEKVPSTAIGYYIYEAMKVALKVSTV